MIKQVIIVRSDLKMDKGKIAAQVAHASLDAYRKADPAVREKWESEGSKKVVLKVGSKEEMITIYNKIKNRFPCSLIKDAGRTQVTPGSVTALGIGPCKEEEIDRVTGGLKLL